MKIRVNGHERTIPELQTVQALLEDLQRPTDGAGIAVAINGEVVRRGVWSSQTLREGDDIEILGATQGG